LVGILDEQSAENQNSSGIWRCLVYWQAGSYLFTPASPVIRPECETSQAES
jgi:hypothetical protein